MRSASVLHVPDLELVVAGDVIYNGVHMYLAQGAVVGGFGPWREAIDKVEALAPRHIVAGHQNEQLDDYAEHTIAETGKSSERPGPKSVIPATRACASVLDGPGT